VQGKVLESLGSKLAEGWIAQLLTPAFVFWAGGVAAWVWRFGWAAFEQWVTAQVEVVQIILIAGGLVGLVASALVVRSLELSVLRLLEGYWPRWLRGLRRGSLGGLIADYERTRWDWEILQTKTSRTFDDEEDLALLEAKLRRFPVAIDQFLPTRLGNILRAERRMSDKYGLEVVTCWPRLWLLLTDGERKELADTRTRLDLGARIWLWSVLFVVWSGLAWWAAPLGIVGTIASYRQLLGAAEAYGLLLESAFDVRRGALYAALRWPLPATPAEEEALGRALSAYLHRGSDRTSPTFSPPLKPDR